jgi:hypothetical protein
MLNTAGMREFRAGVGTIGRRAHVGFRTLGGPPTGSIPLRIAHLHTAAAQARFRTMAVAAAGRNRSQQGRGIREKIERADQENDSQMEESAECAQPRNCIVEEPLHGGILRRTRKKTDRPSRPGVLLPGSCNQVANVRVGELEKEGVPDKVRTRFQIEMRVRIWCGDLVSHNR